MAVTGSVDWIGRVAALCGLCLAPSEIHKVSLLKQSGNHALQFFSIAEKALDSREKRSWHAAVSVVDPREISIAQAELPSHCLRTLS